MNDQRPIVCGTDFSPTAVEAVDIAAAMARRLGTKLVLVFVGSVAERTAEASTDKIQNATPIREREG